MMGVTIVSNAFISVLGLAPLTIFNYWYKYAYALLALISSSDTADLNDPVLLIIKPRYLYAVTTLICSLP